MSHTNSTTNYGLPQFLTSDKPAWLTDINNAFSDIDTAVYNAQTKADTAYTDAGNAQLDATTAINNAAAADAKGSGAIASIEAAFDPTTIYSVGAKVMYNSLLYRCVVAVVTPGPWTGSDNWERITVDTLISSTDAKIGSLYSLNTSDKSSLVGAVNEVYGGELRLATFELSQAINAGQNVSYTITRTDLNLPTGAKVKSCTIRQRASSSANPGFYYSASVNESNSEAIKGVLGNGSSYNVTYYLIATVFYTLV